MAAQRGVVQRDAPGELTGSADLTGTGAELLELALDGRDELWTALDEAL